MTKAQTPPPPLLLFADDDPDTLGMLGAAARLRGWEYETAGSAEEVMEKVEAHCGNGAGRCFDAIVLDVTYKGNVLTGIGAARAIRRRYPNLPIVFATGYDNRLTRGEALEVGQEVVVKPFTPDYILDRAELWMSWAPARYEGPERRVRSINRTHNHRRATDRPVQLSRNLREAIEEVVETREHKTA
jgi:CheY-like chemotaxis protein